MKELVIFGAKSIALSVYLAVQELYVDCRVLCFIVTDKKGNPDTLCGLPVLEAASYEKKEVTTLLAIPQNIQQNVWTSLNDMGYQNIILLDSEKESELMRRYYEKTGEFRPLRTTLVEVYMTRSHKDHPLKTPYERPAWIYPIQAGRALSDAQLEEIMDSTGDNISAKNANYCELTALYWIWKNRLCKNGEAEYYGFFQYRRVLELSERDIRRMAEEHVDVVLPYPTACEPCIWEHHERYVKDSDWDAMLQALSELQHSYYERVSEIFNQQYMYNFNIILAKRDVLRKYCEWLFPILERTEELSMPRGQDRADRYIGYLGENLLTLYFLYNKERLNIRHTGRLMLV